MRFHALRVEWHNTSHKSGMFSTEQLTFHSIQPTSTSLELGRTPRQPIQTTRTRHTFHEMSALAANQDAYSNQDHAPTYLKSCIYLTSVMPRRVRRG